MLDADDKQKLAAALTKAYDNYAELRGMVAFYLDWNLNTEVQSENLTAGVTAILKWGERYDDFVTLLTKLRDMKPPRSKTLHQLAAQLLEQVAFNPAAAAAAVWYSAPNPFGTCFLQGRAPFINRSKLRNRLEKELRTGIYRVLVVNGDPGTGKSFTLRYISFLVREQGAFGANFFLADIDLKKKRSSQVDVPYVVESIYTQVGGNPEGIPRQNGQSAHYSDVLAEWLDAKARGLGQVWCVVLDGFDSPLLPDEVKVFIHHLAVRAMLGANLRLLLLSYPVKELPSDTLDVTDEEKLGVPTLTDIQDFFGSLHQHMNRKVDVLKMIELARDIAGGVAVARTDPEFVRTLAKGVKSKVLELFP